MNLSEKWEFEDIENEIMDYLNQGKTVVIENGCLNDNIVSYSINPELHEREVVFTTTTCVFPKEIDFMGQPFSHVSTEDYQGTLFVKVS